MENTSSTREKWDIRFLAKMRRWALGLGGLLAFKGYDDVFNYSTFQRNLYTNYTALLVGLDYKINFRPGYDIERLHARTAQRIYDLCKGNGGLYIKFGQQIATIPVLPPEYVNLFKQLYDRAPYASPQVVRSLIEQEFGKPMEQVFESFNVVPEASASIAQVHKAKLHTGQQVAVKIQKPEIKAQMDFDLFCYRWIMKGLEFFFGLPVSVSAEYVSQHIREEIDFIREAKNAEKCMQGIQQVPLLKQTCHVPRVFWEYTTQRIMTAEWIDGTSFHDYQGLKDKNYPIASLMETVVNVFADQIFRTGFVHADPHPGNILIRDHPRGRGQQVVLLDHGLYVQSSEKFKREYALFWKSLFTLDMSMLESIAKEWHIPDVGLFATATLARPWKRGRALHVPQQASLQDAFTTHSQAKARVVDFMQSSDKMPQELIFIGRNLNCIRAINKAFKSPVNRINIMAHWAAFSLGTPPYDPHLSWMTNLGLDVRARISYCTFKTTLFVATLGFYLSKAWQHIASWFGYKHLGFEQVMDNALKEQLEQKIPGIVIDDSMFTA